MVERHKIVFTVPEDRAEMTITACAEAGAGTIGAYRRCAFSVQGVGTVEPLPGANPAVGQVGRREDVLEARIEMSSPADNLSQVLRALREAHPYEEPAIDIYELSSNAEMPAGRIGGLNPPLALRAFSERLDHQLNVRSMTWGDPGALIARVAVTGGAADGEWKAAKAAGANVFVTGEVKQHIALEAVESGMAIIAAGHFATENPGSRVLMERMRELVPEISWLFFEPAEGAAGRPF